MNPGKLNRQIVIQGKSATTGDYGGPAFTWSNVATVWASVQPLKGRELIAAQAVQSEITTRFIIRYRSGITAGMRISYGGQYYDIQSVIDTEDAHKELQIMASAGMSEG